MRAAPTTGCGVAMMVQTVLDRQTEPLLLIELPPMTAAPGIISSPFPKHPPPPPPRAATCPGPPPLAVLLVGSFLCCGLNPPPMIGQVLFQSVSSPPALPFPGHPPPSHPLVTPCPLTPCPLTPCPLTPNLLPLPLLHDLLSAVIQAASCDRRAKYTLEPSLNSLDTDPSSCPTLNPTPSSCFSSPFSALDQIPFSTSYARCSFKSSQPPLIIPIPLPLPPTVPSCFQDFSILACCVSIVTVVPDMLSQPLSATLDFAPPSPLPSPISGPPFACWLLSVRQLYFHTLCQPLHPPLPPQPPPLPFPLSLSVLRPLSPLFLLVSLFCCGGYTVTCSLSHPREPRPYTPPPPPPPFRSPTLCFFLPSVFLL